MEETETEPWLMTWSRVPPSPVGLIVLHKSSLLEVEVDPAHSVRGLRVE